MRGRADPASSPGGLLPVLKEGLDRLGPDRGAAVLLLGGSPSDREAHLERLFQVAEGRRVHVVRLEVHPFDQQVPFGALLPWLSRLVASRRALKQPFDLGLPSLLLAGILGGDEARALQGQGGEPPRASTRGEAEGPLADPEDVRTGLLDLVEGRVRQNPTLLSIDHAERLDLASQEWLRRLSSELGRLPLLLVLSFNREPREPSGPEWAAAFSPSPLVERIPETTESEENASPHALPPSRESRRLLAAVAAAGPEARPAFLAEVLELPLETTQRALRRLQNEGWLREREGVWYASSSVSAGAREAHDRAADASLHHAMARAMERSNPSPHGATLLRIADHWEGAGLADPGVERMLEAVRECDRWGAPEVGEGRLQRALLLAQNDPSLRGRELEERVYAQLGSFRMRAEDPIVDRKPCALTVEPPNG
ncbi:MAG: ATP-binding protein [Euryarchaeota archaeon]|nr:ATP-binding protein [Euryarchaeota archaeon]MDE2045744.1 ATP-binding protein [Thermoplasmata archaeon]